MTVAGLRRSRLRAAAMDEGVIAAITVLLLAMAVSTGAAALGAMAVSRLMGPLGVGEQGVILALVAGIWLFVRLAYGTLAEGGPLAASPGKRLVGLRVAGPDGQPPGYLRALARHVAKTSVILSLVGLLAAAAGRCWHDAAARTRVLPAR